MSLSQPSVFPMQIAKSVKELEWDKIIKGNYIGNYYLIYTALSRKIELYRSLKNSYLKEGHNIAFENMPYTEVISQANDKSTSRWTKLASQFKSHIGNWILKNNDHNVQQDSIIVPSSTKGLKTIQNIVDLSKNDWVLQHYIDDSMQLKCRKCHIRCYVLCIGDFQLFIHALCAVQMASAPFTINPDQLSNASIHQSNSYQKQYQQHNGQDQQRHKHGTTLMQACNEWVDQYNSYQREGQWWDGLSATQVHAHVFMLLTAQVKSVFEAALDNPLGLYPMPNCYQLFACDFLIQKDLTPKLVTIASGLATKVFGTDTSGLQSQLKLQNDTTWMAQLSVRQDEAALQLQQELNFTCKQIHLHWDGEACEHFDYLPEESQKLLVNLLSDEVNDGIGQYAQCYARQPYQSIIRAVSQLSGVEGNGEIITPRVNCGSKPLGLHGKQVTNINDGIVVNSDVAVDVQNLDSFVPFDDTQSVYTSEHPSGDAVQQQQCADSSDDDDDFPPGDPRRYRRNTQNRQTKSSTRQASGQVQSDMGNWRRSDGESLERGIWVGPRQQQIGQHGGTGQFSNTYSNVRSQGDLIGASGFWEGCMQQTEWSVGASAQSRHVLTATDIHVSDVVRNRSTESSPGKSEQSSPNKFVYSSKRSNANCTEGVGDGSADQATGYTHLDETVDPTSGLLLDFRVHMGFLHVVSREPIYDPAVQRFRLQALLKQRLIKQQLENGGQETIRKLQHGEKHGKSVKLRNVCKLNKDRNAVSDGEYNTQSDYSSKCTSPASINSENIVREHSNQSLDYNFKGSQYSKLKDMVASRSRHLPKRIGVAGQRLLSRLSTVRTSNQQNLEEIDSQTQQ